MALNGTEVVISTSLRTVIGTFGGTLKDTLASDLGAIWHHFCSPKLGMAIAWACLAVNCWIAWSTTACGISSTSTIWKPRTRTLPRSVTALCIGGGMGIAAVFERSE